MTVAVCTRCGGNKHGAWTACPGCRYDPVGQGLEEEARALYLTDHYRTLDELRVAAETIRAGGAAPIDESFVATLVAEARQKGATTLVPKGRLFITCAVLVVVLGGVSALLVRACAG